MAINKQSNIYTVVYIVVMVLIVGFALAITSLSLKSKQQDNANADKMRQILSSIHIAPKDKAAVLADFDKYVVSQAVYNAQGEKIGDDAFAVNVETQSKLKDDQRELPLYQCRLDDGAIKYVVPVYGAGLWGPIWGYLALDADGSTVYGAYFAHQGETPGLGAEIEKPAFCDQFEGKQLIRQGAFVPIEVVKKGLKPVSAECDYVDAISGGTITSKGVSDMLSNCLMPYRNVLMNLNKQ